MKRLVRSVPLPGGAGGRFVVEDGKPADAAELLTLYRAVLEEGRYFITSSEELVTTVDQHARLIETLARQENGCCLVGRLDRTLVAAGFIHGGRLRRMQHVGKLEIFVSSASRGQGLGRAMMEALVTWAEENPRLHKLGLSVFADNARAVALYQALGFQVEGRREREYREPDGTFRDDLLMYRWV